ncbi:hypothetical protein [Christiangramia forsetii]|uniref:Uncharacterized protein n=2 Tax=Christiangramia forsetii TaxID=411153 RepID=A0M0B8_CHRFK|nr:hypothetical protein [Christiangramia forsetii]GGG41324.1 hypothetical protein GCM10011532_26300 [Christiangramia forsetii]CAL66063.1 conserved hypothetical protein, membrane [Christiangramia forsetii KT0803]
MELDNIEKLLNRYDEGETSLKEEKLLREYFSNEDVPEHLMSYKLMFAFSAKQAEETFEEKPKINSAKNRYAWTSIAAILIVALGIFFYSDSSRMLNNNDLGTISDEELALQKTKETLNMVSQFMNEGKSDLVYLKEFNNTKNKIIEID